VPSLSSSSLRWQAALKKYTIEVNDAWARAARSASTGCPEAEKATA
jgi:hypothetical protein